MLMVIVNYWYMFDVACFVVVGVVVMSFCDNNVDPDDDEQGDLHSVTT